MNLSRLFSSIVLMAMIAMPAIAQTNQSVDTEETTRTGLGKIIAILSTKNQNMTCQAIHSIITTIKSRHNINDNDLSSSTSNGCTTYTYKGITIGKACCADNSEQVHQPDTNTLRTGAPHTISYLDPSSGDIGGSNNVSIYGENFDKHVTVAFGGLPATSVTSYGNMISVSAPAHAAGTVDISVTNQCGVTATLKNGYTYSAQPVISSLSPESGHTGGSKNLTLYGSNFSYFPSVPTVTLGGKKATNVTTEAGGGALSFDAPAHAAATVDLVVTNPSGKSVTLAKGYSYSSTPSITYQSDASGHIGGMENLILMGGNFSDSAGVPTVAFGGVAGSNVSVYGGGSALFVDTPAHAAGTVSIKLTNSDGPSATLSKAYAYTTTPVISFLSAASGDTHGSQDLVIYGANFAMKSGKPSVTIGGTTVTSVTSYGNALFVDPAAHAAGTGSLIVANPEGPSATLTNGYTYTAQPVISSVFPGTGSANGTENVIINGYNFSYFPGVPTVKFGDTPGSNVTVYANGQSLFVDAPAHAAGSVPVTVTNSSGSSAVFKYYGYTGSVCPVFNITPALTILMQQ
ncbi:IPT/TIG domain-containing protein [Solidesulfovibrio sp.]|uniref:IPT/TIG domain-containing protein n=1 Tax=Solidesulfovibrio sp. TaxID=2910990 RepID=UPI002B1FF43B|nr:IPT/TIG domain-containing protein [Solidesulfovibrio sp.]MEA4857579.1 IPT/TIG domain-containing protein [Solidesulfovibrio sp.]